MKKFISLVLVLALCVFAFAACGEKKEDAKLTILDTEYVGKITQSALQRKTQSFLKKSMLLLRNLKLTAQNRLSSTSTFRARHTTLSSSRMLKAKKKFIWLQTHSSLPMNTTKTKKS